MADMTDSEVSEVYDIDIGVEALIRLPNYVGRIWICKRPFATPILRALS
jgi:hypothetical protein